MVASASLPWRKRLVVRGDLRTNYAAGESSDRLVKAVIIDQSREHDRDMHAMQML